MFGHVPKTAATYYGDKKFGALMTLKIISVHLISQMGYDVLFQDADVVWFQHPLEAYFAKTERWSGDGSGTTDYDVIFQADGARSQRFAPYDANSGLYFVRNNPRSRAFVNSLLLSMPYIVRTGSHQQVLIAVLNEHVSMFGLRAKVVSRHSSDLPCGYHWHNEHGMMHSILNGTIRPVLFHMSWTESKVNKIKFFQQMGEWYVNDQCVGKKAHEIATNDTSSDSIRILTPACCSAQPDFQCHFRDKPSLHDCSQSPPLDKKGKSFWSTTGSNATVSTT